MYFKQLLDERCGCASYVIASRQSGEAAIVDPGIVTDPYEAVQRDAWRRGTGRNSVSVRRHRLPTPIAGSTTRRNWRWGSCGCAFGIHRDTDRSQSLCLSSIWSAARSHQWC